MVMQDSKVVAFETHQSKLRDGARRADSARLIAECRSIFAQRSEELLQTFFAQVDDELFKLSDRAENSNLQTIYFDSMRYVRRERAAIEQAYKQAVLDQYDDFWRHKPTQLAAEEKRALKSFDEDSFELVENNSLEEELAINTMIQKGNTLFHQELFGLGKRFGVLVGRDEVALEVNPLAPAALGRNFASVIKPHDLDLKVKLLIYKLFDRVVLSAFGPIYHEINRYLIEEGILPTIARGIKRHAGALHEPARAAQKITQVLEEAEPGDSAAYIEAFQAMQALLDGWRAQLGLPTYSRGEGVVYQPGEVLDALSILQHPSPGGVGDIVSGEGLKAHVANQLGKLQVDGRPRPLGRLEEDSIDMVALIFDYILEDRNLPDPIKALIARLQIPVVKVAILEKSFFARKNHPARLLLNSLAQAGIGLDVRDSSSQNPIYKKIEEVVGRILTEFDQNVDLFAELLDDFTQFMEKDEQRSLVAEERTRQSTQSREQLRLAKKQVAWEIAQRMRGVVLPEAAQSFLFNAWKDVLVLAWLRRDKEPGQWTHGLEVAETVIKTAIPRAEASARRELAQAIPPLLKSIKEELERIAYDPAQTAQILKDLQAMYVACLRGQAERLAASPERVTIKDPELAEAIQEIKANLPDIDDLDVAPTTLAEAIAEDDFDWRAKALAIGEWLELDDPVHHTTLRAKLSWKSQVTSLYVFVNRKGLKVAEMNVKELANRLREGKARVIEEASTPLMDRALAALMRTLKSPAGKASACDDRRDAHPQPA